MRAFDELAHTGIVWLRFYDILHSNAYYNMSYMNSIFTYTKFKFKSVCLPYIVMGQHINTPNFMILRVCVRMKLEKNREAVKAFCALYHGIRAFDGWVTQTLFSFLFILIFTETLGIRCLILIPIILKMFQ